MLAIGAFGVYECLPDAQCRLLAETAVESGLRWGELPELLVRDLDFATRMLTVSRAVVQVHPRFHPDNGRVVVKPYPRTRSTGASSSAPRSPLLLARHAD